MIPPASVISPPCHWYWPPAYHRQNFIIVTSLVGLLFLFFGGTGLPQASAAETNTSPHWPSLKELRSKWNSFSVKMVTQKAEAGDLTAQHYLGYCYTAGYRLPQDVPLGIRWYEQAGNAGYLPSLSNLGVLYQHGEAVSQDYVKARQYYQRAAAAGYPLAAANLGIVYRDGLGVPPDPVEAIIWFRQAAQQNNPLGMIELGRSYRFGRGTEKNLEAAADWFQRAAAANDNLARLNLGLLYEEEGNWEAALLSYQQAIAAHDADTIDYFHDLFWDGRAMPEKRAAALQWMGQAATNGNPYAEYLMGWRASRLKWAGAGTNGFLVEPNDFEAAYWFQRSADQNWAAGQFHLAEAYLNGSGVKQDESRGVEWMRRAADQNYPEALFELAQSYSHGIGEPRNDQDRPFELFMRAITNGFLDAYRPVAFRYRYGLGTMSNLVAAAHWHCQAAYARYRVSWGIGDPFFVKPFDPSQQTDPFFVVLTWYCQAAQGNAPAMIRIANFYRQGQHVPLDLPQAWVWLELARQNDAATETDLAQIEAGFTAEQLQTAHQLLATITEQLGQDREAIEALAQATR